MHHSVRAWGVSAAIAAVLIGVTLMRSPPQGPGQWAVVLGIWVLGTVVLHLLLHNRVMHELDTWCRTRLDRWRQARGAAGPDAADPADASGVRRRGPGHATRRRLLPVKGEHTAASDLEDVSPRRSPGGATRGRRARYDRPGRSTGRRAR